MFGRGPVALAPMAGRTERAIIGDTLAMAGITDPARHVDEFVAELARRAPDLKGMFGTRGHALPGAAAALAAVAELGPGGGQSGPTRNVPAVAEAQLAAVGLGTRLHPDGGAYGGHPARRA